MPLWRVLTCRLPTLPEQLKRPKDIVLGMFWLRHRLGNDLRQQDLAVFCISNSAPCSLRRFATGAKTLTLISEIGDRLQRLSVCRHQGFLPPAMSDPIPPRQDRADARDQYRREFSVVSGTDAWPFAVTAKSVFDTDFGPPVPQRCPDPSISLAQVLSHAELR